MTTVTLPAYTPAHASQPTKDGNPHVLYKKCVSHYGSAPSGYRWLKVGEKIPEGTILCDFLERKWRLAARNGFCSNVVEGDFALAAPIAPELIPADPSAAVAIEVVGRNSKVVRFKIARQAISIRGKGELFTAKDGLKIVRYKYPEFRCDFVFNYGRLYLRGSDSNKDDLILSCTPKRFERIVAALAEYNASLAPKVEVPKPAPVSSEPPKYTGPEITYGHNLEEGINAAGPAPEGWRYLKMGEEIKNGDFRLRFKEWQKDIDWVGKKLPDWYWPVIRRVEPCSPPKSPESIIAELQSEIAALKAKLAEQEKSLAKIKAIVA